MSDRLETLSYQELYKRYDETTDTKLKQTIQLIVDRKSCEETNPRFQAYPDVRNPKLQDIVYRKKEFHPNQLILDTTGINHSCGGEFSIKSHQIFLKNFMTKETPYQSLLVYHGVGVGKTCTGLTIAENFRDIYATKDKRILILCSANIQIGWKQTIYNPSAGSNQCTGDVFSSSEATTKREVNKLIKQYYEIMAYQSFSNYVKRMIGQYIAPFPEDQKEQAKQDCIRKYFSNRLLIIDEVHNIRDDQGGELRDVVKTIQNVIRYSDNLRLLLLTATPMYNRSTEIIWILNMMLLNDKRPLLKKDLVFDSNGTVTEMGARRLREVCRGYVSYLRGENPITFPLRLYPSLLRRNDVMIYKGYKPTRTKCTLTKKYNPKFNLVGGRIQSPLEFLELFGSKLSGFQYKVYNQAIQNLLDNTPDLDVDMRGDVNPILDNIMLTQISNIVYPTIDPDMDDLQVHYGPTGLSNCMNKRRSVYSYQPKVLSQYGPIFDKDILPKYSSKIASILDLVDTSEGIVFIYTTYIDSGIVPLKLALEQNGYRQHTGQVSLDYPEYSRRLEGKCKREPISFNGKRKSELGTDEPFQQATFMVIDGSVNRKTLQEQLKIVNSPENANGESIKIILGTVVASEGLDFKRIRSIHILDPWLHLNRIEQTVGRGIRFCSHNDLEDQYQNVVIYLHTSTLANDRESVDTSIYRYAEKKSIQIGDVEIILKQSAVDRYLYKDVNVIESGRMKYVDQQPSLRISEEVSVDPTDKPYSKVCSYKEDCDYNRGLDIEEDITDINGDTFVDTYSEPSLRNIKKKISSLYREFIIYDINSMLGLLGEYGFNNDQLVFQALTEMINDKYIVYDKQGNSGTIINKVGKLRSAGKMKSMSEAVSMGKIGRRQGYYLFQPLLYDDPSIPLYYRKHISIQRTPTITLPRIQRKDSDMKPYLKYDINLIQEAYQTLDTMVDTYEQSTTHPDCSSIISRLNIEPTNDAVIDYVYDQLSFHQKCALIYNWFTGLTKESPSYKRLQVKLRDQMLSKKGRDLYNYEITTSNADPILAFVVYNHKPIYFEFVNNYLVMCNQVQQQMIRQSIRSHSKSSFHKQFLKTTPIWGYTTVRKRGKLEEYVLKIVKSSENVSTRYPPGPGNICIDNTFSTRKEDVKDMIETLYPELQELIQSPLLNSKKNLCFLIEILFRLSPKRQYYPYDLLWMKYI